MSDHQSKISLVALSELCNEYARNNYIDPANYKKYGVKRGLRNDDGSGVIAGLTRISNVHGYVFSDDERIPDKGRLTFRGINLEDIVNRCTIEGRFGFEEVVWLLLFGELPDKAKLDGFRNIIAECRELPEYFAEDMIFKAPSSNIMNKIARSVLALYSYDSNPDNTSIPNILRQSIELIAQLPTIMSNAYQVKRHQYEHKSMFLHPIDKTHSTAEFILSSLRPDRRFDDDEAKLLDICLMLHAEHGGGNNSTFATRVLSSSGTDTYSAIAAAIGSLKGPRHGGANIKTVDMLAHIKENVKDYDDDDEISAFLCKLLRGEAGDHSGLIYGMGHAVYTVSDPRAVILHANAKNIAARKGFGDDFKILEAVERLTPEVFAKEKGIDKPMCANVDLYSGLVYRSLGIPDDLFTPIFAISRIAGWCAHRIEEFVTGGKIVRPAYKSVSKRIEYVPIDQRPSQ